MPSPTLYRRWTPALLLLVGLGGLAPTAAAAPGSDDWTSFRSDAGQTGTVGTDAVLDGLIPWSLDLDMEEGLGENASPILVGDYVLLAAVSKLILVEASTGRRVWTVPWHNSYQRGEPIVAEGRVFVPDQDVLRAYALEDGHEIWSRSLTGEPVLAAEGRVFAVNWQYTFACQDSGRRVVLNALDASTGALVWSRSDCSNLMPGSGPEGPVLAGDVMYFASVDNLTALRASDGAPIWSIPRASGGILRQHAGSLFLYDWGDNETRRPGVVFAYDAADGRPKWNRILSSNLGLMGEFVVNDHGVFLLARQRDTDPYRRWLVALDGTDGRPLWQIELEYSPGQYNLALRDDALIVTGVGVHSFDARSGELRWKYRGPHEFDGHDWSYPYGRPAVGGGRVLVAEYELLLALDAGTGQGPDRIDENLIYAILAAAAVSGAVALLGAAWFLEPSRYVLLKGAVTLPGFTRLARDQVVEHEKRSRLYDTIRASPGLSFMDLRRLTRLANGTLVHHLRILEHQEYIRSRREGIRTRFFLRGPAVPTDPYLTRIQRQVLDALRSTPGATHRQLAKALSLPRRSVAYHLRTMTGRGLVRSEGEGRRRRHYAADDLVPPTTSDHETFVPLAPPA